MASPQLLSGARGLIQLFNPDTKQFETIAFSTDINVNIRAAVRPTYVMGRMNAGAIDTLMYDADVSVGRVVPVNAPDAALNAGSVAPRPETATAIQAGLETAINLMVSANDLNFALQDKVTGAYVASVKGCRFSGRNFTMNAGDIANERLNFVGIYDAGYQASDGPADNTTEAEGYGV